MSGHKSPDQQTAAPRVGFLSLGCPKALVDSEHIVTELQHGGAEVVAADGPSDVLVINTCGFIEHARDESFAAIDEALQAGQEVVVTGCLGADARELRNRFPGLRHISGPADVAPVMQAVQEFVPLQNLSDAPGGAGLRGEARTRLTPEHYAYLKISEGCNHKCTFCIIPSMRGGLRSRALDDVVAEAQLLAADGARELLVVAQDLSAYGLDLRYASASINGETMPTDLEHLCVQLADIVPWVRLHYVYPYPHVDRLIPLMADGKVLPYLDMPLQHASPSVLKAMRRPAAAERSLERIRRWREQCPDLSIRSTFIVGFPGETDADVGELLDFLDAAQLDRVGCFTYSPVEGARANALSGHVDERDKMDRQEAVYELQAGISAARLDRHTGRRLRVLVDEISPTSAIARSQFDAPEIDGVVHLDAGSDAGVQIGEFVWAQVTAHDDHDLFASVTGKGIELGNG